VGSWLAIAFGVDGGFGSSDLCRPLLQRPALLGLPAARPRTVRIRVTLLIPDEDMSRLHARIDAWDPERRALSPEAVRAVDDAVGTLLEVMRGLGNESSTSALDAEVACPVSAEGIPGRPSSLP
jgi:hypothetical protein